MSDDKFELSRRNALIGLGTVGAASAGAGMGTSAYFSDTEEFQNNTIQAGELNVYAEFDGSVNQGLADPANTTINNSAVADGNIVTGAYQIADAKPGDTGSFTVTVCVEENPAYAYVAGSLTETSENGYTEPETEDNNGEGELEEAIEITSVSGVTPTVSSSTSLRQFLSDIEDGVMVDGGESSGAVAAGNCIDVVVNWEIPGASTGNEIQSDSLEFSLAVAGVQERHYDEQNETNPLNSSL